MKRRVSERNDFTGDAKRLESLKKERKALEAQMRREEEAIEEQKRIKKAIQKEKHRIHDARKRTMTAEKYNSFLSKTIRATKKLQVEAKRIHKEIKKRN
jgi:ferredoxin-NADP reductase